MKAFANNQTIAWFYQRFKENTLELSPDFQRNPVWLQPQKDYLIETILLSLPVPEVYLVNRINPNGDSIYVVVDGQQRLRTIIEFITEEHKIKRINDSLSQIKKFNDLSDPEKQKFWRFPIVVRDLEDSSDEDVRDLFQRLNKYSFKLNDQELRNAKFKGEFLKTVEKISENDFWINSGLFSPNEFRRMSDLEFIGLLLSSLIGGIYNRKDRLDEFYSMYESEFEEADFYIEKFHQITDIIKLSLPNIKTTRWTNKADFFTLFLFVNNSNLILTNKEMIEEFSSLLNSFEKSIEDFKATSNPNLQIFMEYNNHATADTNSKEPRIKRLKILTDYIKEKTAHNIGS